jgi:putative ABC transport system substrate-binding protein
MKRREFMTLLGGATLLAPLVASAQEAGRTYRVGGLHTAPRDAPHHIALFDELRRFGFVEGQNLIIDWRGYGLSVEQYSEFAAELVKTQVDVILAGGDASIRVVQKATATIPILALTDDMLGQGFVRSLAKPGGNTTGVTILAAELDGKRQEILMETVLGLRRMAALADTNTTKPRQLQALQDAARARGFELSIHGVARPEEIVPAINRRRLRMPQRSTCWRHLSYSTIARSFLSALRRCACRPSTSGRKWQKRAALSVMARASSSSIEI